MFALKSIIQLRETRCGSWPDANYIGAWKAPARQHNAA
jgi:hypothetical protein